MLTYIVIAIFSIAIVMYVNKMWHKTTYELYRSSKALVVPRVYGDQQSRLRKLSLLRREQPRHAQKTWFLL